MEKQIGIAYARVSTDDQAEYSPSVQIEDILEYASKNNIYIPKEYIFIDEGISGKSADNRPAFQQMIKTARKKSNNVSVILVHKYDRFSRKKDDQVLYKALLKKDGVKVLSVKEPIPQDDKFAVIYESMLEAMAEYYSLNLAEEVKKTMVKKAEKGDWQTTAPFGYKNENKTLAIVPEEAEVVKMIFNDFLNNVPMLQIAYKVNAMGFLTHRGNTFELRTIQYILNNPVYCGYTRWTPSGRVRRDFYNKNSIIAKGTHPSIIDEFTFKRASEKWKTNKRKAYSHQRPLSEGKHWLSGIVKCSACGRSLVVAHYNKNGTFSMQCGGYNHGRCSVSHSTTSMFLIDAFLKDLKAITDIGNTSNYPVKITSNDTLSEDNRINQALLNKAKTRLNKAKEAYLAGVDSLAEYKVNKENIESEIHILEAKIKEQKSKMYQPNNNDMIGKLSNLYDILTDDNVDMLAKKEAMRNVVEKIVYNKANHSIELYLYSF